MAKFKLELPDDVWKQMVELEDNLDYICGEVVSAGARTVLDEMDTTMPDALKESRFSEHISMSVPYITPSDGAVNVKVYVAGYETTDDGRRVPAGLIVNAFEYGTSDRFTKAGGYRGSITKQPFFRKSFNKAKIDAAMRKAWEEKTKGILNE